VVFVWLRNTQWMEQSELEEGYWPCLQVKTNERIVGYCKELGWFSKLHEKQWRVLSTERAYSTVHI
jgi:hypothetical protein